MNFISFIIENIGTILVGLIVAVILAAVIAKMFRDKKKCRGCGSCPYAPRCNESHEKL